MKDTLIYLGHYLLQKQLNGSAELNFEFDSESKLLPYTIKNKEISEVVSKNPVSNEEFKSLVKSLQMGVVEEPKSNKMKVYL